MTDFTFTWHVDSSTRFAPGALAGIVGETTWINVGDERVPGVVLAASVEPDGRSARVTIGVTDGSVAVDDAVLISDGREFSISYVDRIGHQDHE